MRVGWKLPLERLSASSMASAIQCPEMFRQKYLLKTEEKNFGARFVGSVDHEMSRALSKVRMAGEQPPNLDDLYATVWNEVLEADGEPDWRDADPVKMAQTGIKMAHLYWEEVLSKIVPVAVEERIEFKLPEIPSRIVGYVDLFESALIRERKTTAQKTTKPKPKWRFQGMIYAYATGLPVRWDVVTRQVTPQLYLAEDHPDLYLKASSAKAVRQMIVDTARRINDLYSQYGADRPWPTTGIFGDWLCDYCPIGPRYQRSCPAWIET